MLVDAVKTRLEAEAPAFAGRVRTASDLAALMAAGQMPQGGATAFVLPLALRAVDGDGGGMAGVHTQMLSESVGVLIVTLAAEPQSGPLAARGLTRIETLIDAVIAALAGWTPEAGGFAVALQRGTLIPAERGWLIYQLDFSCQRQLRLTVA